MNEYTHVPFFRLMRRKTRTSKTETPTTPQETPTISGTLSAAGCGGLASGGVVGAPVDVFPAVEDVVVVNRLLSVDDVDCPAVCPVAETVDDSDVVCPFVVADIVCAVVVSAGVGTDADVSIVVGTVDVLVFGKDVLFAVVDTGAVADVVIPLVVFPDVVIVVGIDVTFTGVTWPVINDVTFSVVFPIVVSPAVIFPCVV